MSRQIQEERNRLFGKTGQGWVCRWLIESRGDHPLWWQYVAHVCPLRDLPGFAPAIRHRPDVSHEFLLYAIDPKRPATLATAPAETAILTPPNMGYQFAAESDDAAISMCAAAIREAPSLDTDFRRWWNERFRGAYRLVRSAFEDRIIAPHGGSA